MAAKKTKKDDTEKLSFEEAIKRLKDIVESIEQPTYLRVHFPVEVVVKIQVLPPDSFRASFSDSKDRSHRLLEAFLGGGFLREVVPDVAGQFLAYVRHK